MIIRHILKKFSKHYDHGADLEVLANGEVLKTKNINNLKPKFTTTIARGSRHSYYLKDSDYVIVLIESSKRS